eukprot:14062998-Alexandrium_andersonii.AAC.1
MSAHFFALCPILALKWSGSRQCAAIQTFEILHTSLNKLNTLNTLNHLNNVNKLKSWTASAILGLALRSVAGP